MQGMSARRYPPVGSVPASFPVLAFPAPSQATTQSPPINFDYSAARRLHLHRALDKKFPFPVFGTKDVNRSRYLLLIDRSIFDLNVFPDNLVPRVWP